MQKCVIHRKMMLKLKKSIDNQKLRFRFLCRRLGLKSYQIHQIHLPEYKLIYIPIPKNACTSIKHALHEIEFGKQFNAKFDDYRLYQDHHDYYIKRSGAFTGKNNLEKMKSHIRFTVVREPVKRLLSCYRNRVVDLGDLDRNRTALRLHGLSAEPDLNTFAMNLDRYRKISSKIEHHSRPQSAFLDGTLRYLDKIYRMEDLDELFDLLKKYKPGLTVRHRKRGGTRVALENLSEEAFEKLLLFYRDDYTLLKSYYPAEKIKQRYKAVKSIS